MSEFYPITITESRYGTYSGDKWVLIAGVDTPRSTDAFGSDTECRAFWEQIDQTPSIIDIDDDDVYIDVDSSPEILLRSMAEYFDD